MLWNQEIQGATSTCASLNVRPQFNTPVLTYSFKFLTCFWPGDGFKSGVKTRLFVLLSVNIYVGFFALYRY